jgi:hypothetical protein
MYLVAVDPLGYADITLSSALGDVKKALEAAAQSVYDPRQPTEFQTAENAFTTAEDSMKNCFKEYKVIFPLHSALSYSHGKCRCHPTNSRKISKTVVPRTPLPLRLSKLGLSRR